MVVGSSPVAVIIYNLTECFTVFHLILLRIVLCVFDKFFEYVTLLLCLLIVQRGFIILFMFDAGQLKPIPWDSWSF